GWNGMMTFGMIYYLLPELFNTKLYSQRLATLHFWVALAGILIYYVSMWAAGITQGMMWMAVNANGQLVYPDFVETVTRIVPLYWVRAFGGFLFIIGAVVMVYNMYKTIAQSEGLVETPEADPIAARHDAPEKGHRKLEGLALTFSILAFVAIAIGSVIELLPTIKMHDYVDADTKVEPYTPLELAGRDIYIREGCYTCHSQMIRKLSFDVMRFGPASEISESIYNRPFQFGSKRTGPDLARLGGKYPDLWHYRHMLNPRDVIQQSIMPNYPWLAEKKTDFYSLRRKLSVMKMLGVPYSDETVAKVDVNAENQAKAIAESLREAGVQAQNLEQLEIVALIGYLQSLGQKVKKPEVPNMRVEESDETDLQVEDTKTAEPQARVQ
ncbi:MAG: cytochrome-c oxidase, cbb3-type subunit II, partial [Bdellovibrionales bacterium]|nr:cytochrome-c oxidase, cbb3-type subunit II [Bdellovibrionales bacterium]